LAAVTINGLTLELEDDPDGGMLQAIVAEVEAIYRLDDIPWQAGDVVVDIGAHVGVVSAFLGKAHPELRVYALEPVPAIFRRLRRNLRVNGADRVKAFPLAVSGDGRRLRLAVALDRNSGGSSAYTTGGKKITVPSTTLEAFCDSENIDRIRLLKIDCEGAEHEILRGPILDRIDYISGEIHTNPRCGDGRALAEGLRARFGDRLRMGEVCRMAD
jgi:FkbM family methyltransferase